MGVWPTGVPTINFNSGQIKRSVLLADGLKVSAVAAVATPENFVLR